MKATKIGGGAAILLGLAFASVGTANLAGATGAKAMGATGGGAPPGNNGTIKIDTTALVPPGTDANHPHVTCSFALSFFGYDTGTQTAVVTFTAQPPSGTSVVDPTVGPSTFSFTGQGPGNSLDASQTYELNVAGLSANPQQGYHIKVTVDVTGSQGADEKYKVFWYEPCAAVTTTTTTTPPTTTGTGNQGSTTTTTVGPTTTLGATTTTTPPTTTGTGNQASTTTTTVGSTTTGGNTTTTVDSTTTGGNTTTTVAPTTSSTASGNAPGETTTIAPLAAQNGAGVPGGLGPAVGASVGAAAGAAPASAGQGAQSPASALPTGAGTDLGSFNPTSWTGSTVQAGEMLIAGGVLLCAAGGFAIRRKGASASS